MTTASAAPRWTTDQLKAALFQDRWHRQFFIEEFIELDEPEHAMPWEYDERRPELGAILVTCNEADDAYSPFEEFPILSEFLFIDATEIDAKREAAYAWVKQIAARDITAGIVVYTVTGNWEDFKTLELLPLPWMPNDINAGDRIRYDGIAYPLPGAYAVRLAASGVFELTDVIQEGFGMTWYEIRDVETEELLVISGNLLQTAEFLRQAATA